MALHRRDLIIGGAAALGVAAPALAQDYDTRKYSDQGYRPPADRTQDYQAPGYRAQDTGGPLPPSGPSYATPAAETYSRDELVGAVSNFFGVTAEAAGSVVEKLFREHGQPTGYIAGEEGSASFGVGLRYGKGLIYMKNRKPEPVYWQGPSVGWDFGGNASRAFTLCYNLQYPEAIYRRYPGVDGSAYLVGGLGVNYQRAEEITLAPIRAGLGLRLGANVGYLSYSRHRNWIPL